MEVTVSETTQDIGYSMLRNMVSDLDNVSGTHQDKGEFRPADNTVVGFLVSYLMVPTVHESVFGLFWVVYDTKD